MAEKNTKANLSALDSYVNRVYVIVVLLLPIFCLCASSSITIIHYMGLYPHVNEKLLWLFDLSDVFYLCVGIYLARTGFGEDGVVKPERIKLAKIVMIIILVIQWNGITYIWPFHDLWAYCVLFVLCEVFFFDVKFTGYTTFFIVLSMIASWFIQGEPLLPVQNDYYMTNMIYRVIGITLMLFSINVVTFFGGKFLVEELEKYANYDTLTHLLNRKSMDNYLKAAYRDANGKNVPFCLLMIDIDDFKKVNDTYGHDCGDEVLKTVAAAVSCAVKKQDNVFRWGGEEILVLLRANEIQAASAAERIRKEIEESPVNYRDEVTVNITVTIGVAPYVNGRTIQDMMDDADQKLYYGKKHGKNQVVVNFEG